jgi:predicted GIY-YIG superfamily endonuclease
MDKIYSYFVYILTNKTNSVFYTGITNNLLLRIAQHKLKINDGFTKRYNIDKLVYFEHYTHVEYAIKREKQMKKWKTNWKKRIIRKENPEFRDLIYEMMDKSQTKELNELLRQKEKNETPA